MEITIDEFLKLNIKDAYRLSWDDKYKELCMEQGIECVSHVTFDVKPMPQVKNKNVWKNILEQR